VPGEEVLVKSLKDHAILNDSL